MDGKICLAMVPLGMVNRGKEDCFLGFGGDYCTTPVTNNRLTNYERRKILTVVRAQIDEIGKQLPVEFKFIQSTEQAFYLVKNIEIDGIKPNDDDIVLEYNNDILVGSAMWDGKYTVVPVMGRDVSYQTAGFCEVGDNVEFKLYSTITGDIINLSGSTDSWNSLLVTHVEKLSGTTDVNLPSSFTLKPAFPNPFNPVTTILYGIPTDGIVTVGIYDVNGRLIENLTNGFSVAGNYSIDWNASSEPSGVYFVKLGVSEFTQTQKLILVK